MMHIPGGQRPSQWLFTSNAKIRTNRKELIPNKLMGSPYKHLKLYASEDLVLVMCSITTESMQIQAERSAQIGL